MAQASSAPSRWEQLRHWIAESDVEPGRNHGVASRILQLSVRVAILLGVFLALKWGIQHSCRLSVESYFGKSILWALLSHNIVVTVTALVIAGVAIWFLPPLRRSWHALEHGSLLRGLIGLSAAILTWAFATYAPNFYFAQYHLGDRALLLLLTVLIFWRPVFVLPFVAFLWAVIWQFNYPELRFSIQLAEFKPLTEILTLFAAAFLVIAIGGGNKTNDIVFLALCIVAANFWAPGYAKVRIGWMSHGHLYFMFVAAHTHGWLAFLKPDTVVAIAQNLSAFDWPMRIGTIILECGALLFFLHVRLAKWLLIAWTLLLGGFFTIFGYFFWKWMALHVFFLILFFFRRKKCELNPRFRNLFALPYFILSIPLIGGATFWNSPAKLAWFDTPLAYMFRYEGIGESGSVYELSPRFFAPYQSHVTMAYFRFLAPGPSLVSSYGVTGNRRVADALLQAQTIADVEQLEAEMASTAFNARKSKNFDLFIRRRIEASNRDRQSDPGFITIISPPPFLWSSPSGKPYQGQEPIHAVNIFRVSSFYDGANYRLFRKELLRTVKAVIES